ncbi:kinase-like protein [Mycena galericulata]|nr:kinase-like protein [Mycena galericulata]
MMTLRRLTGRAPSKLTGCATSVGRRSKSTIMITRAPTPLPAKRAESDFHPVEKGEIFSGHYEALRMLGRGAHSTVWLARDTRTRQEVAMKLLVSSRSKRTGNPDELGIMSLLRDGDSGSPGKQHICQLLDSFVHDGPNGRHVCIVVEPLGMSVFDVYESFPSSLPLILVQRVAKHLLQALQYIHECGVIHTDIKGDNILMTGVGFEEGHPKVELDINHLFATTYKLTDFGSANKLERRWAAMIQPIALRSPEVLIGAPWDTKADIWNFGCLMCEFALGTQLFDPSWQNEETGMNPTQTHLAQMVGLMGTSSFPQSFLAKGKKTKEYFDESGCLRRPGAYGITLTDLLSRGGHLPDELPPAADFLSRALIVDPEARWSAAQLLEHEWMQKIMGL